MPLTRLTHFTPSRNLPHILQDGELRSVADMTDDVRACYNPTDLKRLDGQLDKISCSFQFPNSFYWEIARRASVNYPDWTCLVIDKMAAAMNGTFFCPRNASAERGTPGLDALRRCYAPTVVGQGGKTRSRGARHDPRSATDVQAEVQLVAPVPLSVVRAMVFPTREAAEEEYGRLDRLSLIPRGLTWLVAGKMFDKWAVSKAVTDSQYFQEDPWFPTGESRP